VFALGLTLALSAGTLGIAGIILFVGVLIGSIGIGGMFIVPSISYLGGMEIHIAIATAMASYIGSGTAGVIAFSRRGSIAWRQAILICSGAVPGAFLGAVSVVHFPGLLVECVIAGLTLLSGLHALVRTERVERNVAEIGVSVLVLVGLVVGFGSAISGTGGPLILLPILMWLRVPILIALGAAHLAQVTIAVCATAGNLAYAELDIPVAIAMALLLAMGVAIGVVIAHRIPAEKLRGCVAVALIVTGIVLFGTIAARLIGWLLCLRAVTLKCVQIITGRMHDSQYQL
jgi:uncharacterized membrane protein YfcA